MFTKTITFRRDCHRILSELREILENFQKSRKFAESLHDFMKIRSKFANFGAETTKILVVARLQKLVVDQLPEKELISTLKSRPPSRIRGP